MSGGRNEGFLLLVVEMKLSELNEDNVAQVLLALSCNDLVFWAVRSLILDLGCSAGYQLNVEQTIHQPVYALLTDLRSYYFFSFNGSHFTRSAAGNIRINRSRKEFFIDMAEGAALPSLVRFVLLTLAVSERLFGALLKGYTSFLREVAAKSKVRGELGDVRQWHYLIGNPYWRVIDVSLELPVQLAKYEFPAHASNHH